MHVLRTVPEANPEGCAAVAGVSSLFFLLLQDGESFEGSSPCASYPCAPSTLVGAGQSRCSIHSLGRKEGMGRNHSSQAPQVCTVRAHKLGRLWACAGCDISLCGCVTPKGLKCALCCPDCHIARTFWL